MSLPESAVDDLRRTLVLMDHGHRSALRSPQLLEVTSQLKTPMLLKTVQSRKLDPKPLITHRFKLDQVLAYETFGHAASTGALKVIIEA